IRLLSHAIGGLQVRVRSGHTGERLERQRDPYPICGWLLRKGGGSMTTKTWMAMTLALLALSQIRSVGTVRAEESSEESEKALFRRGAELWPKVCANCHNPRPG